MVEKTKISPRVIWLEDDRSSSAPRVRANGKTSGGGTTSGGSSGVSGSGGSTQEVSCTATPFSNGYDEVTLYCYNNIIINNRYRRSAYVACDYVQ
jgi:hypothetical protein